MSNMTKARHWLGGSLLILSLLASHSCVTDSATTSSESRVKQPFLWRIEKDQKSSVILGTIHIGVDAERDLPPSVLRQYQAATTFVMETDIKNGVAALLQPQNPSKFPDQQLKRQLGEVAWNRLKQVLPLEDRILENVAPGMLAMLYVAMLSNDQQSEAADAEESHGPMDLVFHNWAQRDHKLIRYLEDASDYNRLFGGDLGFKQLQQVLSEDPEKLKQESEISSVKILSIYRQGDLLALEKTIAEESMDDPMVGPLLEQRNELWVERLKPILGTGNAFIAVGVGHMTGPRSVLKLLQQRGYHVTRL